MQMTHLGHGFLHEKLHFCLRTISHNLASMKTFAYILLTLNTILFLLAVGFFILGEISILSLILQSVSYIFFCVFVCHCIRKR